MVQFPYEKIFCAEYQIIRQTKVSGLVNTLLAAKINYLLIVEPQNDSHLVKGFFWGCALGEALTNDLHQSISSDWT